MPVFCRTLLILFSTFAAFVGPACADLSYEAKTATDGMKVVVVSGEFSYADDLRDFTAIVRSQNPDAIVFDSPGGNVMKAIQLGHLIRSFGLETLQFRGLECASACSLAFLGGVVRAAEPGSIGVHRSSFTDTTGMDVKLAVREVQRMTAEVMTYMIEMGTDPALLQLSLAYDAEDIRYLSGSEMDKYRVTTPEPGTEVAVETPDTTPGEPDMFTLPKATTGKVRHPSGFASLKSEPNDKAAELRRVGNGTSVSIVGSIGRWYSVTSEGKRGYMHHTWVQVDQYLTADFDKRYIQIMSYDNYAEAAAAADEWEVPYSIYLASNGWFAVTLKGTFERDMASQMLRTLRTRGEIPSDSFATFGNTFVRQVCCE
jgi:hypothetical protein